MSKNQGKVVLVTGASSGIGYATAVEFAKRGYKVYAGARRLEPMEPLKKHGVIPVKLDVSSLDSVKQIKIRIEQENDGKLDYLYNNAGQLCTFPAIDTTDEWFKQCYEVNVFGPMRLTRELSHLLINAKGTVGFTGSVSGLAPFPLSSTYSSTKAAIHAYAGTLRLEMKPFGVKVINFVTGGVKTEIADTRPLPETSLYNVPPMKEALIERQQMAARNNPMPAEKYAYKVVNDFEAATLNGPLNKYRGHGASYLHYLFLLVPTIIIEWAFVRKFKLVAVYRAMKEKYSKVKLH